jgi:GTP-binding protein
VDDRDDVLAGVGDRLAFLGAAPVLKLSAKSGKGVHRILPALRDSVEAYHQRVPTGPQPGPAGDPAAPGRAPGPHPLHRAGGDRPPTFTLFTNGRLPQTYLRYIERGLREKFEFGATPMKLRVRIGGK